MIMYWSQNAKSWKALCGKDADDIYFYSNFLTTQWLFSRIPFLEHDEGVIHLTLYLGVSEDLNFPGHFFPLDPYHNNIDRILIITTHMANTIDFAFYSVSMERPFDKLFIGYGGNPNDLSSVISDTDGAFGTFYRIASQSAWMRIVSDGEVGGFHATVDAIYITGELEYEELAYVYALLFNSIKDCQKLKDVGKRRKVVQNDIIHFVKYNKKYINSFTSNRN